MPRPSSNERRRDPPVERVYDPDAALDVYLRHPAIHPYGIADVAQLWDDARWWRRGDALLGVMELPGSEVPVIYAIAAEDAAGTLVLFETLEHRGELPARFVMTGPIGVSAALAPTRRTRWCRDYEKLAFPPDRPEPADDPRIRVLGRTDLTAIEALFTTDAAAGDLFHPGLLDTAHYLGIDRGAAGTATESGFARQADASEVPDHRAAVRGDDVSALAAVAGIHVIEPGHGVAAIGNVATDPAFRGRGLGTAVVSTLTSRLRTQVDTVGLNVTLTNVAARRLYRRIGFVTVLDYEEAELERR